VDAVARIMTLVEVPSGLSVRGKQSLVVLATRHSYLGLQLASLHREVSPTSDLDRRMSKNES
jgi:hypothetical protein